MSIFRKIMIRARKCYYKKSSGNSGFAFDTISEGDLFANFNGKDPAGCAKHNMKYSAWGAQRRGVLPPVWISAVVGVILNFLIS